MRSFKPVELKSLSPAADRRKLVCVPQVRVELWERQIGSAMAELQAKVESAVDQEELAQRLANIEARPSLSLTVASI